MPDRGMMRHISIAAMAVVLGACAIDLIEVEPDDGARSSDPSRPTVTIRLHTDEVFGHLDFVVVVHPGRMEDGEVRRPGNDTLYVDGFGFAPDSAGENGELGYVGGFRPPPDSGIRIRPPRLDGMFNPSEIEVEPLRVVAEDTLVFRDDGAVALELVGVDVGGEMGVTERWAWRLRIQSPEDDTLVNFSSNQRPPPTLTLSTTMVPVGRERGTLIFEAHVSTTYDRMPSLGLVYDIGISRKVTMTVPFRIDRQHGAAP